MAMHGFANNEFKRGFLFETYSVTFYTFNLQIPCIL